MNFYSIRATTTVLWRNNMTYYPTLLGTEPRANGLAQGCLPIIPEHLFRHVLQKKEVILLADEKLYRFPLVVRHENYTRNRRKRGLRGAWYRWMLYAVPVDSSLDKIEEELQALNDMREARQENPSPLLASDLGVKSTWNGSQLNGIPVRTAPTFLKASRIISE